MLHALITLLIFIAVLMVLVLAHEWGHFFVARRFGVRVHEFGFGFPPKIFGRRSRKSGTEYTLNWIPLGGFVRLKGEDGSDQTEKDSFAHKSLAARLLILVAGVAMNFLLGYALFVGVYLYGVDLPTAAAVPGATLSHERVVIVDVLKDSPAGRAGFLPQDEIISVGDQKILHAQDAYEFLKSHPRGTLQFEMKRGEEKIMLSAEATDLPEGVHGIGVRMTDLSYQKYSLGAAARVAAQDTWNTSTLIFRAIGSLVKTLVHTGTIEQGVSGPVGIAVITGEVARTGLSPLLQLMAILSINLGVLNVLPFPALDGGRALFVILQRFFGKRLRAEIEQTIHLVGFALLMAFVIAVSVRDVIHLVK